MSKQLFILIGIPGSGKSYKAKQLAPLPNIFSTDNYWINEQGEYKFDFNKIRHAHEWNQRCAEEAMKEGRSPLAIDNTNLTPKERNPYVEMAIKYGYVWQVIKPDSPWFNEIYPRIISKTFSNDDVQVFFEKNTHGVPLDTIRNMMTRWQE